MKNRIFTIVLVIQLLIISCRNPFAGKIGEYHYQSDSVSIKISIFKNSQFEESYKKGDFSQETQGTWQWINQKDSIIVLTTERSGTTIFTLTPQTEYRFGSQSLKQLETGLILKKI